MAPRCLAFAAIFAVGCSSPPQNATTSGQPLDWHPNLDQPIRQLREVLSTTVQQQPKNYTAANLAFVLDAKLYLIFQQYLQGLPVHRRASAVEEQRAWLAKRAAATDQAYSEYEGGTLASYSGSQAFIIATQDRIAALSLEMSTSTKVPVP
jgi:uncharacterized protein YecT (DUF1311 family)